MKRLTCNVRGRVQGVLFRGFLRQQARALGLVGFAQNLPDGSVAVVAEGLEKVLRRFLDDFRRVPFPAHIEGVSVEWGEPTGGFSDFSIRYY